MKYSSKAAELDTALSWRRWWTVLFSVPRLSDSTLYIIKPLNRHVDLLVRNCNSRGSFSLVLAPWHVIIFFRLRNKTFREKLINESLLMLLKWDIFHHNREQKHTKTYLIGTDVRNIYKIVILSATSLLIDIWLTISKYLMQNSLEHTKIRYFHSET